jgi:hypothetical protein
MPTTHLAARTIARVLLETKPIELVSRYVQPLKKSPSWYSLQMPAVLYGPCPFHTSDPHGRDRSFLLYPNGMRTDPLRVWKCLACHPGGTMIRFVQAIEKIDFHAAVVRMAMERGIPIEYESALKSDARKMIENHDSP